MIDPKKAAKILKNGASEVEKLRRMIQEKIPKSESDRRSSDDKFWHNLAREGVNPTPEDELRRADYISGRLSFEDYTEYLSNRLNWIRNKSR